MTKKQLHIPPSAGIYFFRRGKNVIYVGKAVNLKSRLSSYWRKNQPPKTAAMVHEATQVNWKELPSEIDALIAEAEYIKRERPKYNILMRDDKSYSFVEITGDEFPKIFIVHQSQQTVKNKLRDKSYLMGPFTSSNALRGVLKFLRGIFPYCTCKTPHKRACLNAELGKCFGFCCTIPANYTNEDKKHYHESITNIKAILEGKRTKIARELKKRMQEASRREDFSTATRLRDQVFNLENIFAHKSALAPVFPRRGAFEWYKIEKNLRELLKTKKSISRVEGYDIANISGTEATGSMPVFIDGVPAKSEYRKFKIKTTAEPNDIGMLAEVVHRRLTHDGWPMPDLMLIDGGRSQLNAILRTIKEVGAEKKVLVTSLAKREEELYLPNRKNPIPLKSLPPDTAHFLQRVRDESHRFARVYHHKLREMAYRSN